MLRQSLVAVVPMLLLVACSSSSEANKQQVEKEQAEKRKAMDAELRQQNERFSNFELALIDVDKMLNDYVNARWVSTERAENQALALETAIRERALRHFEAMMRAAIDQELPDRRATALAALGFSQKPEVLDPLLNGLRADNSRVVSGAVLGLGTLRDPQTPPRALAEVIDRQSLEVERRRAAATELVRVQGKLIDTSPMAEIWSNILARPQKDVDSGIAVQALTGLGLLRKPELLDRAAPWVTHPEPLVRLAAAIALGRLDNPKAVDALLTLLGEAEHNPNVRLAARKALQALAGNADYGYDVAQWRKAFERG